MNQQLYFVITLSLLCIGLIFLSIPILFEQYSSKKKILFSLFGLFLFLSLGFGVFGRNYIQETTVNENVEETVDENETDTTTYQELIENEEELNGEIITIEGEIREIREGESREFTVVRMDGREERRVVITFQDGTPEELESDEDGFVTGEYRGFTPYVVDGEETQVPWIIY